MKNTDTERERARRITDALAERYPEALCSLRYDGEPWKLLIMGRLSAQCTDARVNIVSQELFDRFPTARAVADAPLEELEAIVRPCGLFRTKAADIKEARRMLCDEYGGVLPDKMEELLRLPGIVADTHCIRICGRLGFYPADMRDPVKTERIMSGLIEPGEQSDFCHRLVLFGRDVCRARDPACGECPLAAAGLCTWRDTAGEGDKTRQRKS